MPAALQRFAKYDGKWISAPVNVHSTNWVWANKGIMDELGIAAPTSWDELVAALDAIQGAGYVALAHGGQAWQEATIFDGVLMSTGGTEFYQQSMIDLDPAALGSDTMKDGVRSHGDIALLRRRQLLGPRLEPRHRHGHRGQGRHADDGRLGQGRVPERR